MKRIGLFIVVLCSAALVAAHDFATQSVLGSGTWIKIRVMESGVYSLTYDELKEMGLKNPENVRIYGYGGAMLSQDFAQKMIDDVPAVRFFMEKGKDGVFGKGDYILFYGQGSFSWRYSSTQFVHTRNPYSDYGYYFLSDNAGEQLLMEETALAETDEYTEVSTYTAYFVHEVDSVNLLDPTNGENGGGREFYGERLTSTKNKISFDFPFSHIVENSPIHCCVDVAAASGATSTFTTRINGQSQSFTTAGIPVSDFYTFATTAHDICSYPSVGTGTQRVEIQFQNTASNKGWINYVEVATTCQLQMTNDQMALRTTTGYKQNTNLRYHLSNATDKTQIWNITELDNIRCEATALTGSEKRFVGNNNKGIQEYIAVNTNGKNWYKPTLVGKIDNQNLHHLSHIDYVIICPNEMTAAATKLAEAHASKEGILGVVVTDQQVYNEFASGTPDATAYRRLMKMLYDRAENEDDRPKWLLLMGDGTFDNRKILTTSGKNTLLTYQSKNSTVETKAYATDDYFGFMDNSEGNSDITGKIAFGIGRLPVSTVEEANAVVEKIIRYMTDDTQGKWKQQLAFLSDDGDNGLHTQTAEAGAELVRKKNPDFIVNKIYLDAYPQEVNASGESYPLAKNRLDNLLKNGILYLNYSGHGGYNAITNESMMDLQSIQSMTNAHLGFWMLATCSFSHFDSNKRCAAEEAILNTKGGAIGVLSACRTVYATQNTILNRNFCDTLFGHKDVYSYNMTIGEATRIAKNKTNDENKLPYILLGDPALRLNYPTTYQVATQPVTDTINALTIHTMKGVIKSSPIDTAFDFNGKLDITIYDKMQQLTTRDNDEKTESEQVKLTYNDYPNILYTGETKVKNGRFSYTFMTPKDIRYNYGNGRIVYYAYDTLTFAEGVGHYEDFIIGGSSPVLIQDTTGPNMQIYLNTPSFMNGDDTYETPRFFADIYDEHGINTVGSGIGHDLLLVLDNDPKQSYILNEYFTGKGDSYTSGQVSYALAELPEGHHTLTFKAWDLLNNSSSRALDFNVVKGLDPKLVSVTSYPNPVQENGIMRFVIQYDQPDTWVEMGLYVYDLAGRLVWNDTKINAEQIEMNLTDIRLNAGVYVYKMEIHSENSKRVSRSGKIIVTK